VVAGDGAVVRLPDVTVVPSAGAGGTAGLFAAAGTIRLADAVDADACGTPMYGSEIGYFSVGTIVANGETAVRVAWPDLKASVRTVAGGAVRPSPSVRFLVSVLNLDFARPRGLSAAA